MALIYLVPLLKKKLTSKSSFNFRIANQNVRGLRFKLSSLTETWLNGNIFDSEIVSSNFNIYRRDRRSKNDGGVLISICSKHTSKYLEFEDIEFISVTVHNRGKSIYITCSYIPPF